MDSGSRRNAAPRYDSREKNDDLSLSASAPALVAAVVLGLVNAAIRPVLILLTLPATILSLGLFIFYLGNEASNRPLFSS